MLKAFDLAIYRTPVFSMDDSLGNVWNDLKEKIKESSMDFYQIIADKDVTDINTCEPRIRFTIWKYFNRTKYRSTPFGSFAAITLVPLSKNIGSTVQLDYNLLMHRFTDWVEQDGYSNDPEKLLSDSNVFRTNSSVYIVDNEIRYVRSVCGQFELAAINSLPEVIDLLDLCKVAQSKEDIYKMMRIRFKLDRTEIKKLLKQVISRQLLFTDRLANITGEDYFTRIVPLSPSKNSYYTIAERRWLAGSLNARKLKNIPDWINFLALHKPTADNNDLELFKDKFQKRFGLKEIALSVAMDPEIGIGYGKLEQEQGARKELEVIDSINRNEDRGLHIPYTDLHRFLLNRMMSGGFIQLHEFDNGLIEPNLRLPNTLSVMLHFWRGHPVIENAGGYSANMLIGRFTMAGGEWETYGKQIAAVEKNANPDIIFFDIPYQAEKHVDNINRRKILYDQELPLQTWSCFSDPLTFGDIMVSVKDNEVILRSKKYDKRLVPRIPSAYNYSRSDLSAYRFLCDIQTQGLNTDFNFTMQVYFPGLDYYPRVYYKDVIVSPAMWLVPREIRNSLPGSINNIQRDLLVSWMVKFGISDLFKAGDADRALCFNPLVDEDLDFFLVYCRQSKSEDLYITEALISADDMIEDTNKKKYLSQIIVNYCHEKMNYQKVPPVTSEKKMNIQEIMLPGSEWLYFELYCHPHGINELLSAQISPFLKEVKSFIKKWFFVRFDKPEPHLRLRLQLKKIEYGFTVIHEFKTSMESHISAGLISDLSIKTYFREMERYGVQRMDFIEQFFYNDSKYILQIIKRTPAYNHLYETVLMSIQNLFLVFFNSIDERISFVKDMADRFSHEMQMRGSDFRKINETFKHLKSKLHLHTIPAPAILMGRIKKNLTRIFQSCHSDSEKARLMADLIHMHINRLFSDRQRHHEAIIYLYLLRLLQEKRALLSY